ncbi:Ppx/GppA phosphatase family protein [Pseudemcibacter aquimaris]|uniref:Ppx/GppA phosphatase family protein n=1 Tax=Pseudemcibacter aquimaris TaxID=2857064 RepID=UPI0020123C8C|nr:Ppx/GppA phosphatase family protein [Pseudemcibacter aquimaris]MCC3861038.1 Ppx/GppA family phosphatase [Pseudemcibacter aquimaris]WDU59855.1 Ppx/GppA family phosphatase [Pseudemcibacter aquimaris]
MSHNDKSESGENNKSQRRRGNRRLNNKKNNRNKQNSQQKQHVYGVVDLGTNNCRLLVAVPQHGGFRVIDSFSRIVRLGEGLKEEKRISDHATERTVSALKVCMDKMRRRGVTRMWNVATQACREAENGDHFVKTIEEKVKIKLDIIDPQEEARLAVMGCKALLDTDYNRGIVFDIGGGSTEIIWIEFNEKRVPQIIDWISIPLGVVNLSEEYGTEKVLPAEHYEEMKERVKEHIEPFEKKHNVSEHINSNKVQLMGTSGTVTTLTSMHLNQAVYDRNEVDGAWMKSKDLVGLCNDLAKLDYKERLALNNIGNDRAELVVAGCAIFDAIIDVWPIEDCRVADRGIREGMLHHLMDEQRRINKANRRRRSRKRYYLKRKNKDKKEQVSDD